jgi:hypothetical protein
VHFHYFCKDTKKYTKTPPTLRAGKRPTKLPEGQYLHNRRLLTCGRRTGHVRCLKRQE